MDSVHRYFSPSRVSKLDSDNVGMIQLAQQRKNLIANAGVGHRGSKCAWSPERILQDMHSSDNSKGSPFEQRYVSPRRKNYSKLQILNFRRRYASSRNGHPAKNKLRRSC
eukprot:scaffold791_cov115-Cylindrotheca_fusiformis.AAC.1